MALKKSKKLSASILGSSRSKILKDFSILFFKGANTLWQVCGSAHWRHNKRRQKVFSSWFSWKGTDRICLSTTLGCSDCKTVSKRSSICAIPFFKTYVSSASLFAKCLKMRPSDTPACSAIARVELAETPCFAKRSRAAVRMFSFLLIE